MTTFWCLVRFRGRGGGPKKIIDLVGIYPKTQEQIIATFWWLVRFGGRGSKKTSSLFAQLRYLYYTQNIKKIEWPIWYSVPPHPIPSNQTQASPSPCKCWAGPKRQIVGIWPKILKTPRYHRQVCNQTSENSPIRGNFKNDVPPPPTWHQV